MNEDFLHYIWKYQLFCSELKITNSDNITVLSAGLHNTDSGPDFFNAQIVINSTLWAGNVELHVKSSDWYKHNHQFDEAYNSIILHVVYENDGDIYRKNGEVIPTVELKRYISKELISRYLDFNNSITDIPCMNELYTISKLDRINWFDFLAAEKLEHRLFKANIELANSHNNFMKVYYQQLSRSFGYLANADNMELLSLQTPFNLLSLYSDDLHLIESILFGQSGLLPYKSENDHVMSLIYNYNYLAQKHNLNPVQGHIWKFMRMRPASFPTIRISQFAVLLHKIRFDIIELFDFKSPYELMKEISVEASDYWTNHYRFSEITTEKRKVTGVDFLNIIVINAIIPSMFLYGKLNNNNMKEKALSWLSQLKPENNNITRKFKNYGIAAYNSLDSQALIHLYKNYCLKKKCIHCKFGHLLMNKTKPELF